MKISLISLLFFILAKSCDLVTTYIGLSVGLTESNLNFTFFGSITITVIDVIIMFTIFHYIDNHLTELGKLGKAVYWYLFGISLSVLGIVLNNLALILGVIR